MRQYGLSITTFFTTHFFIKGRFELVGLTNFHLIVDVSFLVIVFVINYLTKFQDMLHCTCECAEFTGLYLTRVEMNVKFSGTVSSLLDSFPTRNVFENCLDF